MKSIITKDFSHCFLCGRNGPLDIHHIFGGPNRPLSTKYGLIVPLCRNCHTLSIHSVHQDYEIMDTLRKLGQEKFIEAYPDLDFIKLFGRNYL